MKRKNNRIFLIAIFAALIIVSALLLIYSEKTFFPEKLGDMELKLHREGDIAMREIQKSHSSEDNVNPDQAHIARYRSRTGNRAIISVTVAETEKRAVEKVENMTKGMGGMFSIPEVLEINGLKIYYTAGGGEYHYYYSKNDLVTWIALSNPDREYQSNIISNAVKIIGG